MTTTGGRSVRRHPKLRYTGLVCLEEILLSIFRREANHFQPLFGYFAADCALQTHFKCDGLRFDMLFQSLVNEQSALVVTVSK